MLETERVVEEDLVEDIVCWGWLISEKKGTWMCQQTGMI